MNDILQGKTALITGASSGLGVDFARQLAARGCNLVLVARRMERMQELRTEIAATSAVSIDCRAMDLTKPDAPQRLYEQLKNSGQTIDILINNAGHGLFGQTVALPWDKLHSLLELDIVALTYMTRLFVPDMVKRRSGYIVQIASTGSFQPTPTYAVYSAAKSYVLSFGEALHYELRRTGVTCTVLCPGVTRTEFFEVSGQRLTMYQRLTMMESAAVARIGISAMLRRRSSVVAGKLNSIFAFTTRFLPRQVSAAMAHQLMR
jgi:short-subunit dehydrogenase